MIDHFDGEHAFLSNFSPSPIIGPFGLRCATVEHAFQAAKATRSSVALTISSASTPGRAKRQGRVVFPLRENWEAERIDLMRTFIHRKFEDPELRAKLLATGDEELVEGNSWGDRFWGCDRQGNGENWLGRILMDERAELRGP